MSENSQSHTSEAVSTTGLFLNMTAVIALVLCLGALATAQFPVVAIAGAVSIVSFSASLVCFVVDERRSRVAA